MLSAVESVVEASPHHLHPLNGLEPWLGGCEEVLFVAVCWKRIRGVRGDGAAENR